MSSGLIGPNFCSACGGEYGEHEGYCPVVTYRSIDIVSSTIIDKNDEHDNEESIQIGELSRLRKVFETSSDLLKAQWSEEFCDASGGFDVLKKAHADATVALEKWYADADDSCR